MNKLNPFLMGVLFILLSCGQSPAPFPHVIKTQKGLASWYGHPFHGRLTASGEVYNMHDLTAAHKSLPFGTRVRVTRKDTQAFVAVRINDRGPFKKGRIIDLSYAAAQAIGLDKDGVTEVWLSPVASAASLNAKPKPSLPPSRGASFYLQVASYPQGDHAHTYADYIAHLQPKPVSLAYLNESHKVWVGPFFDRKAAYRAQESLSQLGLPSLLLRRS